MAGVIRLDALEGGIPVFKQIVERPIVYLDHWAMIKSARNLADRLAAAIEKRKATLAVSALNLIEIAGSHPDTTALIRALVRKVFPRIVFAHAEVGTVMRAEEGQLAALGRIEDAFLDEELLQAFATVRRRTVDPLSTDEFFEILDRPEFQAMVREESDEGVAIVHAKTEEGRNWRKADLDRAEKRMKEFRPSIDPRFPPTRHVYVEAMNHLLRGKQRMSNAKHHRDLQHTVVPVSNFDYVLLDGNWEETVRQIRNRLRKSGGVGLPRAKVYSDLEAFFGEFESDGAL